MAAAIGVAGFSSEESSDENLLDDQPSTSSSQPQANSAAVQCSLYEPPAKRCLLDNSLFNAAVDRTNISTQQAMMIVTPALAAAGVNVNKLSLSRSSMMEARNTSRETLAATVRMNFQPTVPLVAHFDGKLLRDIDGTKRDCLPVVVSGLGIAKLLVIPMLPVGTGTLMGQKVVEFLREWSSVEDHLTGLCFDTTASNLLCLKWP